MQKLICKYSKYCGGCNDLDKSYEELVKEKENYLKSLFKNFKDATFHNSIINYYPYKYRNKVHLAFGENKGKTLIGFYEENSNKITDIDSCLMHDKWLNTLIAIIREYLSRFKIRAYKNGNGILRYLHARCINNNLQLTLVAITDNFAGRDWLYKKLCENFNQVSFYLNINRRTDNAIFGDRFKHIAGEKFLKFNFAQVDCVLTPSSFLQVNLPIAEKMYKKAIELLDITKNTTVIDLYSGIGITSVMFSRLAKNVFAIEEVSGATSNAKIIAKINNSNNIHILTGKCEDKINSLKLDECDDVVLFVDPARLGLNKRVIDVIREINPRKIVYMSCNPESCVNDTKLLIADNKYGVCDIYMGDMFPYTKHIESLVCLCG